MADATPTVSAKNSDPRAERAFRVALLLLLVVYGVVLMRNLCVTASGSDSSGYLNATRMLTDRKVTVPIPDLAPLHLPVRFADYFLPLGFARTGDPLEIAPSYPVGVPAHMALFATLFGWSVGPFLVSPLAALGSVLLIAMIVRALGYGRTVAFLTAAALTCFPTVTFQAIQPMSDVVAMFWALVAIYAMLRAESSTLAAFLCGMAAAIGIAVRPTSALLLLGAVGFRSTRRGSLAAAGGFLLAIAPLLWWQQLAYGHMLSTGYGSIGYLLSPANVPVRVKHYLYWLAALGSPLLLVGTLYLPFARSIPLRLRAALLLPLVATFAFYCFYQPYETWWYTRFLLPVLPAMLIGEMALAVAIAARVSQRARAIVVATLLAIPLIMGLTFGRKFNVLDMDEAESHYLDAVRMTEAATAPEDLIVGMQTSGSWKFYTGRMQLRWDLVPEDDFQLVRAHAAMHNRRIYALLFHFEVDPVLKKFPGAWEKVGETSDVTLWHLRGG